MPTHRIPFEVESVALQESANHLNHGNLDLLKIKSASIQGVLIRGTLQFQEKEGE